MYKSAPEVNHCVCFLPCLDVFQQQGFRDVLRWRGEVPLSAAVVQQFLQHFDCSRRQDMADPSQRFHRVIGM